MIINWYPGHMAKAKRLIQENLKIIDVVIELVDARIPMSSTNPMIKSLIGDKPSVVVLNKADLADPAVLDEWVAYYKQQGRKVLALNSKGGKGVKQLISLVRSLAAPKLARWKARGLKNRAVRTMILGIPNVGKSTLINKLSRRSAAKTADKPGETKGKQWVHIGDQLDLLDTPGVLWPKLENQVSAYRLAATGAISDTVFDMETVIMQLIEQLSAQYPDELKARYKLETLCDKPLDTIEAIGRKRGCIVCGGVVDLEKTYKLINKLSRRSAAKTADKPGETKGKQWVHIGDQLDLLDTPGVLWPKLENQVSAYRLAATGAISDTVFDMETVIMQLIEQLSAQYPDELKARYKLETLCDKPLDTIEAIGRKRGCIVCGGVVDLEKTYKLILKEFREGKIGAISLDRLGEWEGED